MDKKQQGTVELRLHISETGEVQDVDFVSGDPMFQRTSVDAARKFHFAPYVREGKPTPVVTKVTIAFRFFSGPQSTPADTSATKPLVESFAVEEPALDPKHRYQPEYPQDLKYQHISGDAVVKVWIAEDGSVSRIEPLSGDRRFIDTTVAAIRLWKYKPFLVEGKPTPIQTLVKSHFWTQ